MKCETSEIMRTAKIERHKKSENLEAENGKRSVENVKN